MAQQQLISEVTGTLWKIEREVGERVEEGDVVMILESMKMEIPVEATMSGTIKEQPVSAGDSVEEGDLLCVIE
ncbi:acetyl-CoA carboxylase biotin carboxyl carrier protein subunit [Halomonas daqingensis]|uniref:Acetyl-CoA carboxylase biotin carboxyl carrier protein subunit n=1 Tax=Billgrantia desiderata TaxID=52021 RepID=A0ABS9B428_9GAMM|nr:acetyl-CoA carboxylase biotin carboxyl carrier protein subunit [Halomonas desiderata]MCE8042356.1 acetyl-CoA carboxylase biotin carboxyl carrier protein subunit [Halomonas desiderata]MCE8046931.1 acetyl-CoA carboxylase biotin carboxyl carrier protein subunit [Halomonas desiderata]